MKRAIQKIRLHFWGSKIGERLSETISARCERCPLCAEDRSDWHNTGYIEAYCSLIKGNAAEGCIIPRQITFAIASHRRKLERKWEAQYAAELAKEPTREEIQSRADPEANNRKEADA